MAKDTSTRDEILRRRQLKLDEKTSEILARIYIARRIEYQLGYYQSIVKENEGNSDIVFRLGALVMTISSLTAALGTLPDATPQLRLITALLPAFAALLSSFSQLYQWDRQATLYQDTALALERSRLVAPDLDELDPQIAYQIFGSLVQTTEKVFEDEVNQWGQIALGKTKEGEEMDVIKAFAQQFNIDIYDETGKVDEKKVGDIRRILQASQTAESAPIKIQTYQATETQSVLEDGTTVSSRETTTMTVVPASTGSETALPAPTESQVVDASYTPVIPMSDVPQYSEAVASDVQQPDSAQMAAYDVPYTPSSEAADADVAQAADDDVPADILSMKASVYQMTADEGVQDTEAADADVAQADDDDVPADILHMKASVYQMAVDETPQDNEAVASDVQHIPSDNIADYDVPQPDNAQMTAYQMAAYDVPQPSEAVASDVKHVPSDNIADYDVPQPDSAQMAAYQMAAYDVPYTPSNNVADYDVPQPSEAVASDVKHVPSDNIADYDVPQPDAAQMAAYQMAAYDVPYTPSNNIADYDVPQPDEVVAADLPTPEPAPTNGKKSTKRGKRGAK